MVRGLSLRTRLLAGMAVVVAALAIITYVPEIVLIVPRGLGLLR